MTVGPRTEQDDDDDDDEDARPQAPRLTGERPNFFGAVVLVAAGLSRPGFLLTSVKVDEQRWLRLVG